MRHEKIRQVLIKSFLEDLAENDNRCPWGSEPQSWRERLESLLSAGYSQAELLAGAQTVKGYLYKRLSNNEVYSKTLKQTRIRLIIE